MFKKGGEISISRSPFLAFLRISMLHACCFSSPELRYFAKYKQARNINKGATIAPGSAEH